MADKTKKIPSLSKSRFMAGIQCEKRLYLECYHRGLADPVDANQQAVFDSGTDVGVLARQLCPGGILIDVDFMHFPKALSLTKEALASKIQVPLFEAAFEFDDVRTRVDILKPLAGDAFSLIEVKSSSSLKEEYVLDAAIQYYILMGAGINVTQVCLAHLNKEYVYPGGEYDLTQLFTFDDITKEAQVLQPEIKNLLQAMRLCLAESDIPPIKAGKQCTKPYTCSFYGYCHRNEPAHHISQLPRISEKLLQRFEDIGVNDILQIPADFSELNEIQQRVHDCVVNNTLYLDKKVKMELSSLIYPVHFLDFETFNPALPLYIGTRPYEVIPFQWSDHILDTDGKLRHEEFLHNGPGDPRPTFAVSLIKTLGKTGSIVVYSGYEAGRIKALADALPQFSDDLLAILSRIFDLLPQVRNYCYHPEFHGSFSIKSVLPALVPGMSYKDLEINEGGLASLAYLEIISLKTTLDRRTEQRTNLLKYCERDTEAMVRLVERLKE
jgi:hypothetical protein